jgi:hypothetical protein
LRKEKVVCLVPLEADYFKSALGNWIDFSTFDLDILRGDVTEEEVCKAVADATVIFGDGRHRTHITRRVIEAAPRLRLIQMPTVGYDEVDLEAADEHGIPVSNTAGCNAVSVAEHAIMFMLVLLKKGLYAHESTLRGEWPQMELVFSGKVLELGGKTRVSLVWALLELRWRRWPESSVRIFFTINVAGCPWVRRRGWESSTLVSMSCLSGPIFCLSTFR